MSEESKEKAQPLTYWDRVADKGLRKYIKDKGLPLSVRIRLPCVPASRRETFHILKHHYCYSLLRSSVLVFLSSHVLFVELLLISRVHSGRAIDVQRIFSLGIISSITRLSSEDIRTCKKECRERKEQREGQGERERARIAVWERRRRASPCHPRIFVQ